MRNDFDNKRPILVTGAHRSGTTWVGTMIGKSRNVCYMWEPFNFHFGPGICNASFKYHFPYISEENEDKHYLDIQKTIQYKYYLWQELKSIKTRWQLQLCIRNFIRFQIAKIRKQRPLFKDPIAVFSAQWLEKQFGFQVVILIRHPAAFAASVKRLNWNHPFGDFLKQPQLMEDRLSQYKLEIEDFAKKKKNIVDQAILLWKLIYSQVILYQKEFPHWIYLKHEDISYDPVKKFKELFNKLDIPFTSSIEKSIIKSTNSSNPDESIEGTTLLKMNSRRNITNWQRKLNKEEIRRIKDGTEEISRHFYPEFYRKQI